MMIKMDNAVPSVLLRQSAHTETTDALLNPSMHKAQIGPVQSLHTQHALRIQSKYLELTVALEATDNGAVIEVITSERIKGIRLLRAMRSCQTLIEGWVVLRRGAPITSRSFQRSSNQTGRLNSQTSKNAVVSHLTRCPSGTCRASAIICEVCAKRARALFPVQFQWRIASITARRCSAERELARSTNFAC